MVGPDSHQLSGERDEKGVILVENFPERVIFVSINSQLFFWFFPPGPEGSPDDLIFWYAGPFVIDMRLN